MAHPDHSVVKSEQSLDKPSEAGDNNKSSLKVGSDEDLEQASGGSFLDDLLNPIKEIGYGVDKIVSAPYDVDVDAP